MKRTGELLTFNAVANPALNVFQSVAMQTGITPGGNDGLLLLGAEFEFNAYVDSNATREVALLRALKLAMPTILDDDVIAKQADKLVMVTSGMTYQPLTIFMTLPPQSIVVVESNIYLDFKTTGQVSLMSCSCLIWAERVTLTAEEKNAILAARLNNLLN